MAAREIIRLESVDSTNRFARQLAREGAAHGTLVIAREQTAGRGRRGRSWISPAGDGLFMSLILRPADYDAARSLSLQAALAVARAIHRATALDARIKWPNDIVIAGRKVCGMILEMDQTDAGLSVVLGVGINLHQQAFPAEIAQTASSLDLLSGMRTDDDALVAAFLEEMDAALALDAADHGAFLDAYRARSATLGQRVQVIAGEESFTGTALEVTPSGSLLVRQDSGDVSEVLAADVSVRGLMGYV